MNYLFCLLFLLPKKDTCREEFLKEILQTPIKSEYLLVVNVEQKSTRFPVVLTNIELLQNLKSSVGGMDENLISKIKDDQFVLSVDRESKWLTEVRFYKSINKSKKKGEDFFIKKYFDKSGYLKKSIPFKYIGQIVYELFGWNVLLTEVEGTIYVIKKRICN